MGEVVHRLVSVFVACVASVSNRVIARVITPPPPSFLFFALVPTFSTNPRGNACYAGNSVR